MEDLGMESANKKARDPRLNPEQGDIIKSKDAVYVVTYTDGHLVHFERYIRSRDSGLPISIWRNFSADDDVIKVSNE